MHFSCPYLQVSLSVVLAVALGGPARAFCVVTGTSDARVRYGDRLLAPVAWVDHCADLRLVAGQARAVWTTDTGHGASGPVLADSPPVGYPSEARRHNGSTQRLRQWWASLVGERRSTLDGALRSQLMLEAPMHVYVPPGSLRLGLPLEAEHHLKLTTQYGRPVWEAHFPTGTPAAIASQWLPPEQGRVLYWQQSGGPGQRWVLMPLPTDASKQVANELSANGLLDAPTTAESALAMALLFERNGAAFNAILALRSLLPAAGQR
ncbi:MAG: hypothetical protein Q8S02_12575 [Hydrogenophaga sp.]|nr:hypothetical protein [Hydrogenophaga sp.]